MIQAFKAASVTVKMIVIAVALVLGLLAFNFAQDLFSKKNEVRAELSEKQTEAAIQSGENAVNTVTNNYTREVIRNETVRTIQNEVNNAQDFDSAHRAGADGLCLNFGICSETE